MPRQRANSLKTRDAFVELIREAVCRELGIEPQPLFEGDAVAWDEAEPERLLRLFLEEEREHGGNALQRFILTVRILAHG